MAYCACGCGQETALRDGKPRKFIRGHNRRMPRVPGLCACGCGGQTNFGKGGRPRKFLKGHHARGQCNPRFGKPISEETRERISEARKAQGNPWWEGRQHSTETRELMSRIRTGIANTPRKGITRNCKFCGKPYYRPKNVIQTGYCSLHCSASANCAGEKNPFFGKKHTDATKAILRAATAARRGAMVVLPTKPERCVHEALRAHGIDFMTEHPIGPFCVDVYIPSTRTAIFVDGCYWHGCPEHFPDGKKGARRPKQDVCRVPYLTKCGYNVGIVWEHDALEDAWQALKKYVQPFGQSGQEAL